MRKYIPLALTLVLFSTLVLSSTVATVPVYALGAPSVATFPVPPCSPAACAPLGVGIDSTQNKIFVGNVGDASIDIMDGTNTITQVSVGSPTSNPSAVAVNEVTHTAYIALRGDGAVIPINTMTNAVGAPISVGTGSGSSPVGIAVDSVTNKIYVANGGDNTVSVIDGGSLIVNTIPVGSSTSGPSSIAVDEAANKIYVALNSDGTVVPIDGVGFTAGSPITVGNGPSGIGVDKLTHKVYVANAADGTVSVIDGGSLLVTSIPALGSGSSSSPTGIAVDEADNIIFVTLGNDGTVIPLDGSSNTPGAAITVGSGAPVPLSDAFNKATTKVYVGNNNEGSISVISFGSATTTPTSTSLSAPSSSILGQPVTFTATVSPAVPDGETVTFLDGITPIGTGTTTGGVVTFTTSTLSAGPHSITASYPGDTSFGASTSNAVTITVNTLLGQKQSVIPSLQSLTAADKDDKKDLKQAIEEVKASVKSSLWQTDGIHLNVKKGEKVFDEEQEAVQHLMNIIHDKKESASFVTTLQNDISQLVGVDKGLAQTAINDASTIHPDKDWASDLDHANKEFTKASTSKNADEAIDHYKNAWEQATEANQDKGNDDHNDDHHNSDHGDDHNDDHHNSDHGDDHNDDHHNNK